MGVPKNLRPPRMTVGDYLCLLLSAAALAWAITWTPEPAHGAPIYRRAVVAQPYQTTIPYAVTPYFPSVVNQVGAQLRLESAQQQALQNDPEWERFQRFKAYEAGEIAAAAQPQTAAEAVPPPEPMPAEGPPPAPNATPFAASIPVLVQTCASCHGGKDPDRAKGDFFLNGAHDVLAEESWRSREKIMQRILSTDPKFKMPPNHELSADEMTDIVLEIYGGATAPPPAQP